MVLRFTTADDLSGTLTILQLDLAPEMAVSGIHDRDGPLTFTHTEELLSIPLRRPLARGAVDSLTVAWSGQPPRHGSFAAGLMFRTHNPGAEVPIIASLSQTWSAHSWWPCKDHPADKAQVTLAVTVPDTLSAVSNGTLISSTPADPGWWRFQWREAFPLPTYLVSVAVSNYSSWSEDCQPAVGPPVRLEYHLFPEDRANAEYDLGRTCEMMSFLTGLLGPWPYPGEKYAQVEFKWAGGMEHTTATSLAQLLFTGDRRFENLFLHELVHQWLGDSLTPAVWADIWLNEGFARYGEALWLEHSEGPDAYREYMLRIGPGGHPDLFRGEGVLSDPDPILPNLLVYDKGAWVLHMLRGLLGDEAFFAFLRDYASEPALSYGVVTVAEMIAVAGRQAGGSLAGFFMPWLTTDLVPVISHRVSGLGTDRIALTLSQHQQPVFQLPVPVVLHTACGDTRLVARLRQANQTFTWQTDCPVDSLSIAPDGLVLMRGLDSPPPPIEAVGPAPNPALADGSNFELFLLHSSQVTINTYDARGRLAAQEVLANLPATGPREDPDLPGHPWRWTPTDATGRRLPSGLYFLEFLGAGGRQVRRVTLVH